MKARAPHIYAFEGIDASLDLLPLAARRALDASGAKVSLDAWRKAPLAARQALAAMGSGDRVSGKRVRAFLKEEAIPHSKIESSEEPSSTEVPPDLTDAELTSSSWEELTALDRYALIKIARGKHPERLTLALREIAPPLSTHLNVKGEARMVDVGEKETTARRAVARAHVSMKRETAARLSRGDTAKGDVLASARIAGIQAAKRTPELIPLCHHVALTRMAVEIAVEEGGVVIDAIADARDRTGVEMEAMTAASVAALTVYDMLKGVDRGMSIRVELREKTGGKSGTWKR
jgi:cyclic pyranopterin phosphate synthase